MDLGMGRRGAAAGGEGVFYGGWLDLLRDLGFEENGRRVENGGGFGEGDELVFEIVERADAGLVLMKSGEEGDAKEKKEDGEKDGDTFPGWGDLRQGSLFSVALHDFMTSARQIWILRWYEDLRSDTFNRARRRSRTGRYRSSRSGSSFIHRRFD